jgi:alanine racemase
VRETYAEIDLQAIRHNASELAAMIAPAELCAVVKADGYGHGDVPVASAALVAGATRLAVALAEEGIRLREAGIEAPILILSEPDLASIDSLGRWDLTPTVYSDRFVSALDGSGHRLGVHVKLDTGMHRVGVDPARAASLFESVARARNLTLEGVFTHFPVADEDHEYTMAQIDRFREVVDGLEVQYLHMANSAGAILFPESRADFSRVGLSLYGLHPADATRGMIDLKPAMRVVSRVAYLRPLPSGSRPSYGRVRSIEPGGPVATIPMGYADGYARRLTNNGSVLIRGRRHRFAGMVTMDQMVVAVDDGVELGDEVVLMGDQGDDSITADELAEILGTITHEIVCSFGPRVPRRYIG